MGFIIMKERINKLSCLLFQHLNAPIGASFESLQAGMNPISTCWNKIIHIFA